MPVHGLENFFFESLDSEHEDRAITITSTKNVLNWFEFLNIFKIFIVYSTKKVAGSNQTLLKTMVLSTRIGFGHCDAPPTSFGFFELHSNNNLLEKRLKEKLFSYLKTLFPLSPNSTNHSIHIYQRITPPKCNSTRQT